MSLDNNKEPVTIKEMLEKNAAVYSVRNAFSFRKENSIAHCSYNDLLNMVNLTGIALLNKKIEGKNIAVIGKNSFEWCLAYLSVICSSNVVVPLDKELDVEAMAELLKFASVKVVFADLKIIQKLRETKKRFISHIDFYVLDSNENGDETTIYDLIEEAKKSIHGGFREFANATPKPDDVVSIMFTSGTTSDPKAVMLTNENLCSDITGVSKRVKLSCDDSTLCVLPLHHAYQTIVFLTILYNGGSVSCCESLRRVSQRLHDFKPTVFVTVPLMLEKMHKKILEKLAKQSGIKRILATEKVSQFINRFDFAELKKHIYSVIYEAFGGNLRMIIVGAAELKSDVARDFELFGIPVVIGYGLTECSPIVICNSSDEPTPDSIGKPIEGAHVILNSLDENGIGEICVSGPMVMKGYYKNKKATNAVLEKGWLRTGDLGYCDESGNYHITGRIKNVIVTKGGKNVYPEEIESYLNRDPVVLESLIFGDEYKGDERVALQVVPNEDAIKQRLNKDKLSVEDIQHSITEVVRKINRKLPSYKNIRKVSIIKKELDKTKTQKIKRTSKKEEDNKTNEE